MEYDINWIYHQNTSYTIIVYTLYIYIYIYQELNFTQKWLVSASARFQGYSHGGSVRGPVSTHILFRRQSIEPACLLGCPKISWMIIDFLIKKNLHRMSVRRPRLLKPSSHEVGVHPPFLDKPKYGITPPQINTPKRNHQFHTGPPAPIHSYQFPGPQGVQFQFICANFLP